MNAITMPIGEFNEYLDVVKRLKEQGNLKILFGFGQPVSLDLRGSGSISSEVDKDKLDAFLRAIRTLVLAVISEAEESYAQAVAEDEENAEELAKVVLERAQLIREHLIDEQIKLRFLCKQAAKVGTLWGIDWEVVTTQESSSKLPGNPCYALIRIQVSDRPQDAFRMSPALSRLLTPPHSVPFQCDDVDLENLIGELQRVLAVLRGE